MTRVATTTTTNMKKEPRKHSAKSHQYIIICEGLLLEKSILSTLGIKLARGYYDNGRCTALLHSVKIVLVNTFKANLLRYIRNVGDGSDDDDGSREMSIVSFPLFAEYGGILACSGTDEKCHFNAYLKLIKRFDVTSAHYFSLTNDEEDASATSSQKSKSIARICDERFRHLIMRYQYRHHDHNENNTPTAEQAYTAAHLLPFISNKDSLFATLGIIQMKTSLSISQDENAWVTLFTFEKKHAKRMLAECVADYNRWFPESDIQVIGDILGSCKSIQISEERRLEKCAFDKCFVDGGHCVWNQFIGWISENAFDKRRLTEIVIVYRDFVPTTVDAPFFIQCQEQNERGWKKAFDCVNISDLKTVRLGESFHISKMRIMSDTNMGALLNHVGKYARRGPTTQLEASFTAKIPQTMGVGIRECGICVPGDDKYLAASEYLYL